jgi:tripartite-type tricarboxylate transporter receptor subunit TctC
MALPRTQGREQHAIRLPFRNLAELGTRKHRSDGSHGTDGRYGAIHRTREASSVGGNRRVLSSAFLFSCFLLAPIAAGAQSVENFYQGRTISLIVGYPPAGAPDVYGRLVTRHLGKYLPGSPSIIARNMPGAGSILAANYIFNAAPKDGTVLGLLVPTMPLEEALGSSASKYRSASFNWIGRLATAPNITFINNASRVKTIADAFDNVAILGATGRSSTNAIYPTVLNNVLGTKFKVVTGYEGSAAVMLAMERGEVEGHSATYDGLKTQHEDWLKTGKVNIVVQYLLKRHSALPDVPTSAELARTPEQAMILRAVSSASEIGKFILTTPEVPAERVAALRLAFDAMVKDPAYLADAAKLRIELDPLPGTELQKIIEEVQGMPADIVEKIKPMYPLN